MNHLFAIAIDNYQNVQKLNNSVGDTDAIVQVLTQKYQFEAANISRLYNLEANEAEIYNELKRLALTLTEEDNLIIYFAGHGIYDEVTEEGFWLPVKSRLNFEGDYISNDRIIRYIKAMKAKHIFIIADACFSGSFFDATRQLTNNRLENLQSRWALTSGRIEVVSDGAIGKHSPFCNSILECLDVNSREPIAVSDLCQFVKKQTSKLTINQQIPRGSALFIPDDKGGEFIFHPRKEALKAQKNIASSEFIINEAELNILYSNIVKIKADVIVSSDDEMISMKGGVSEAIKRLASKSVYKEAQAQVPAKIGEVIVTNGGKSDAKHIFHCITMDYKKGKRVNAKIIEQLTQKCLETADELGMKSIVFPALGTGAARADFGKVATAMVDTIGHYLLKTTNIEKVTIALKSRRGVNTKREIYSFYQKAVARAAILNQMSNTLKHLVDLKNSIKEGDDLSNLLPVIMGLQSELTKVRKLLGTRSRKSSARKSKELKILMSALTEKAFVMSENGGRKSGALKGYMETNQSVINTLSNLNKVREKGIRF